MLDNETRHEIRILKYQNYVKDHPNKPYGYYCLGRLYLNAKNFKEAEKYFKSSLEQDKRYSWARIGLLEILIKKGKLLKAASYFNTYRYDFLSKKIFIIKTNKTISLLYDNNLISRNNMGFFAYFIFENNINKLLSLYEENKHSIVSDLILSINYLAKMRTDSEALSYFRRCIYFDGISDNLRWNMIKAIAQSDKSVLQEEKIALKFNTIPENIYSTEYANFMFEQFLKKGTLTQILNGYDFLATNNIDILEKNLWMYVDTLSKNSIYSSSVNNSCKKLIQKGWMDKTIAISYKKSSNNLNEEKTKEAEIIALFGY